MLLRFRVSLSTLLTSALLLGAWPLCQARLVAQQSPGANNTDTYSLLRRGDSFVLFSGTGLVPRAYSQEPASIEVISSAISRTVSSETVRMFVTCHFRAALWGGYDAEARLGSRATSDSRARILRVTQGRFIEEIDPQGISGMAEKTRKGIVSMSNREAAFAKGLPIYLSDVALVAPDSLRYTVAFNSTFRTSKQIFPRIEEISTQRELFLGELSYSEQPQQRTSKLPVAVGDGQDFNFGVLINNNVGNTPVLCVSSNEINLKTLLHPAEGRQQD